MLTVAVAVLAGLAAAPRGHAAAQAPDRPVSTLTPAATAKLWRQLVDRPHTLRRAADCRPLRAVFYAATDWLRLATKLAANASPCAQYYISIPPLVSDKTKARPDQAWRIRALGASFHAMAEVHFTTWQRWVAANSSTWYAAGVEARHRMEAAGFDVTKGDTWAVNEFPSSVRANAGTTRAQVRDFVHGLYAGDGTPPTRGVVFIIGVGQSATGISLYQSNLQNWLTDSTFWADMSAYVSDWSQETYGDVRRYAVPGSSSDQRRDYLVDYLEHPRVLAGVGPPTIDPARAYLAAAYSPLANAAWQWASGYGWTSVPFDLMQSFVSGQVYALRYYSATSGQPVDHFGFAWQPRNGSGLSTADLPGAGRSDPRPPRLGDPRFGGHERRPGPAGGRRLRLGCPVLRRGARRRDLHRGLEVVPRVVGAGAVVRDGTADDRRRGRVGADDARAADERPERRRSRTRRSRSRSVPTPREADSRPLRQGRSRRRWR